MNVKEITPHRFPVTAVLAAVIRMVLHGIWLNYATYRRACMLSLLISGKIILTSARVRRRRGQEAGQAGPQGGGAGGGAVPEPAPGAGDRCGVPGQRLLRRPGRGAGQVRDGAQGQGGRRPGHRGRRSVRVFPARVLRCGPPTCGVSSRPSASSWSSSSSAAPAARRRQRRALGTQYLLPGRCAVLGADRVHRRAPMGAENSVTAADPGFADLQVYARTINGIWLREHNRFRHFQYSYYCDSVIWRCSTS